MGRNQLIGSRLIFFLVSIGPAFFQLGAYTKHSAQENHHHSCQFSLAAGPIAFCYPVTVAQHRYSAISLMQ